VRKDDTNVDAVTGRVDGLAGEDDSVVVRMMTSYDQKEKAELINPE
jgi:hypothetical protein